MPRYRIRMTNSEFESVDEADYPSLEAARRAAVATASRVVAEAIASGAPNSSVEVQIDEDGEMVARNVVTLSVSDLSGGEAAIPDGV
ncbi:MAG: DUF6894 family protein [Bacillota bacterium]